MPVSTPSLLRPCSGPKTLISLLHSVYLTTDLNPVACRSTLLTAQTNSQPHIEAINTDLTSSLSDRLSNQVDVLVFNPPYVETEEEEATMAQHDPHVKGIEKTWAGGARGMTVTNRLLSQVKVRGARMCKKLLENVN